MFLRRNRRKADGETYEYWTLVETYRTARGPRQRVVATLGKLEGLEEEEHGWEDLEWLLEGKRRPRQLELGTRGERLANRPQWTKVDLSGLRVERVHEFGEVYLALSLWRRLGLDELLAQLIEPGREEVPWEEVACLLTVARFCAQRSELEVARRWYCFASDGKAGTWVREEATRGGGNRHHTIFHSDRGSQYGSALFRHALAKAGLRQSMSGRANPYDNAWTESLIGTLKHEMLQGGCFASADDARTEIFEYIDGYLQYPPQALLPRLQNPHPVRGSDLLNQLNNKTVQNSVAPHFADAERIILVQDNLNTHSPASLYEAFAPAEAARIKARFEFHFTPKHGSWMNIAEIELSALARGCLSRRIPDRETLAAELLAWQSNRNQAVTGIRWQWRTARGCACSLR